ncbi:uncharacterized protein METZ01_LOCUS443353, partial [marine metagenome]
IIKNDVVESISHYQGELKEKLELLQRTRVNLSKALQDEENSLVIGLLGLDEVKKQYQEIESDLQKLISLDSDYIKEFLAEIK